MKANLLSERGQALILIAFAAIGLFAIAGLAIDGSAKYSDRRHAQNAADTAALAGAYAKIIDAQNSQYLTVDCNLPSSGSTDPVCADIVNASKDKTDANGYSLTGVVHVYSPPQTGIYADCSNMHFNCHDYVQVTLDTTIDTWFARLIGIFQTHNHVEAVASAIKQQNSFNFGGNSIVALSPTGCSLKASGTTDVVVNGGGMFSNSDSNCAFQKTTCSGHIDVNNQDGTVGTITMVGGYTLNYSCWDVTASNLSAGGATQISFPPPYQELSMPAVCLDDYASYPTSKVATLTPGHYHNIPPKASQTDITLEPGVYCVDGSISTNANDTLQVDGTYRSTAGVLLYLMPGGTFTFNGQSTLHIWGINGANSGLSQYAGFLLYAAPNYSTGTPTTCTINGTSVDQVAGTIYAPFCSVKINGSSGTVFESQIVGYTVDLTGASGVVINYNSGDGAVWNYPSQVGLTN